MTDYIEGGYLWIKDPDAANYLKVKVEKIWYWLVVDPTHKHYAGESHMFYDLKKRWWMVLAEKIWLGTHDQWKDFIHYLLDWHDNGPFVLSIYRDTGGSNKVSFDVSGSEVTTLNMAIAKNGLKRGCKMSETSQYWRIESILFEQCG